MSKQIKTHMTFCFWYFVNKICKSGAQNKDCAVASTCRSLKTQETILIIGLPNYRNLLKDRPVILTPYTPEMRLLS